MPPATYLEILEACDGIDPQTRVEDATFICTQQNAEATVDQVRSAWSRELLHRADVAQAEAEQIRRSGTSVGVEPLLEQSRRRPGQPVLEEGNIGSPLAGGGDFVGTVEELVAQGVPRREALRRAKRMDPDGHRQFLTDTNPGRRSQRILNEKFDHGE